MSLPLLTAAMGLGATAAMDLWNAGLKRGFGIRSLDYCLLGRWVSHLTSGRIWHAAISASSPRRWECRTGWVAHYSIGIALATGFVMIAPDGWLARPTLTPALAFGVTTVVLPLFLLQPALGLGVASSRTQHPWRARAKSVVTHTVFGAGLYAAAVVARMLSA